MIDNVSKQAYVLKNNTTLLPINFSGTTIKNMRTNQDIAAYFPPPPLRYVLLNLFHQKNVRIKFIHLHFKTTEIRNHIVSKMSP